MSHYLMSILLIAATCLSVPVNAPVVLAHIEINTPEEAALLASKLANEKSREAFGVSPFTPESYSARLLNSRWHWGKIEPPGINGYSAEVEFDTDGSHQKVRTVLHTDKNFNSGLIRPETEIEIINQEEAEVLEKNEKP